MASVLTLLVFALLSGSLSRSSCSSNSNSRDPSYLGGKFEEEAITSLDNSESRLPGVVVERTISTDETDGDIVVGEDFSSHPEMGLNQQHPSLLVDGNNNFHSSSSRQRNSNPKLEHLSTQKSDELSSKTDEDEGSTSMILLLNGELYTPSPRGRAHILLAGKSIVAIFRDEEFSWGNLVGLRVKIIDVNGSLVVPGLIDIHVHITGGGGEAGPASRTPEASLSELLDAGLTTVVGTLGTDCVSRSLENLRAKAAALKEEGLTAYMWSGCYRVPSPTLTGSLVRDLQLIEEIIGAGEIAISDHRGSWPSTTLTTDVLGVVPLEPSQELLKIVSDARVGGMLSGKAGIAHFHTGAASSLLDPLWDVINVSKGAIPITQMIPTHISSRGQALLEAAEIWIQAGGYVDLTSDQEGESASLAALKEWGRKGTVSLDHISLSSDGFGSLPYYDAQGKLLKYGIASPKANLYTIQELVFNGGWSFQKALSLSTVNPAGFLSLQKKGKLEVGMDGDVVVLDAHNLQIEYVIATGQLMKTPSWTKTGLFGK